MSERFACGLVLAAGGSRRLGRPKQLLPYGSGCLLDHALDVVRAAPLQQRLCVVGGRADDVLAAVDFAGVQVVRNREFGSGCSSSIAAALEAVDPRAQRLVLLLGDQPGVTADAVAALLDGIGPADVAACAYDDGRGHPLAFGRAAFGELAVMHGDKAVWKLLDRRGDAVVDVPVAGSIPADVDTWADYEALLSAR